MPRRKPVFRGPEEVREVWLALAERHGVAGADRILGERLGMEPKSVAYRRRMDVWWGIRWEAAVAAFVPETRAR